LREVSVRILHFSLDLARAGRLDQAALVEGLPSLALERATAAGWVDWSDFVVLWERLELAAGGPEGLARIARLAIPTAYPEFRTFAAVFVSPTSLFTFMMFRHMRTSFRNVQPEVLEHLDDGRIRWRQTIMEPHRPSEAFHRGSRTLTALIPLHLDLEEGETEITLLTPRSAEYITRFPPPPPLATRGLHALSAVTSLVAAQLDEAYAIIAERVGAEPVRVNGTANGAAEGWAEKLELSQRQREVFALLVEGRANKEIARLLRCSERNVEFHVGRILRAARVTSRAELLVKVLGTSAFGGH
jgi:DNA-binding CsgD family transcriptional regulator